MRQQLQQNQRDFALPQEYEEGSYQKQKMTSLKIRSLELLSIVLGSVDNRPTCSIMFMILGKPLSPDSRAEQEKELSFLATSNA